MITRRARNEEINRRKSRRKHASKIQERVDEIVGQVNSRSLLDAVDRGAIEEVERLCVNDDDEDKVNVNYIGSRDLTSIHMSGFASTSKVLIENGADVNMQSCDKSSGEIYGGGEFSMGGHTPLHYCKNPFPFSIHSMLIALASFLITVFPYLSFFTLFHTSVFC